MKLNREQIQSTFDIITNGIKNLSDPDDWENPENKAISVKIHMPRKVIALFNAIERLSPGLLSSYATNVFIDGMLEAISELLTKDLLKIIDKDFDDLMSGFASMESETTITAFFHILKEFGIETKEE